MHREKDLQSAIYLIGPDLVYDRSVRNTLSEVADVKGEVVFSPFIFDKSDLCGDLDSYKMPLQKLLGLG